MKTVKAEYMLGFLKREWDYAYRMGTDFGWSDERAQTHADMCIGMKEMCEALIGVPVNLKLDGRLTIGLDGAEREWQSTEDGLVHQF